MNLRGKRVLVIGGAGFIGSHMTDALIEKGAKVTIVDDFSTGEKSNLNSKAKTIKLNIGSDKFVDVLKKEKPQIVYHFAWFVLVPKSVQDPLLDIDALRGTIHLLQYARHHKVQKIIFASSGFLYGNNPDLPLKETEKLMPVSPYAITKNAAENYFEFYRTQFNVPSVIMRYSAAYGPRQRTGAMAAYIRDLKHDRPTEFYGKKTRDYVYIDDVVSANLKALDVSDKEKHPVFNIGNGQETVLLDLYKILAKAMGAKPKAKLCSDRPGEQVRYSLSAAKASKVLGWKSKTSLEEGLKKTLKYWEDHEI